MSSRGGRWRTAVAALVVGFCGGNLVMLSPGGGIVDATAAARLVAGVAPLISIRDTPVPVPTSGTATATFSLSLSQASTNTVSVAWATHDMTATAGAGDYQPASGTAVFPPGTTSQTIAVGVNGEPAAEAVEGFTVSLANPVNGTPNNYVGTAILLSPGQAAPISVSAVGAVVAEPATGTSKAIFNLTVTPKPTGTHLVIVDYTTADGTATVANGDYTPMSGRLRFDASGPATKAISVPVLHDAAAQGVLSFLFNISTKTAGADLVEGTVPGYIIAPGSLPPPTPIRHVVIIDQENHSFDNVLGRFCVTNVRCDGATTGKLPDGTTIPLSTAKDAVPIIGHAVSDMRTAIDGGKMDGFANLKGCGAPAYACYSQFDPSQMPNLSALAQSYALSDRTFELNRTPSYGSHLELVTATLDGFTGDNPSGLQTNGWGCDSQRTAPWLPPAGAQIRVPSCVPLPDTMGPFQASPVKWVPTIMDRLDSAGLSWHIYAAAGGTDPGYSWAVCPTFADCIYTGQSQNLLPAAQVISDAKAGSLPAFSVVSPIAMQSQHNGWSMTAGDNWLGSVVAAIQSGPDWSSTAIFITYDDCGCFYDHVAPSSTLGVRIPMVIVSPYARATFTDSTVASYTSLMAYVEHVFALAPLGAQDQSAYDYHLSFDYAQTPLRGISLTSRPLPASSQHLSAPPDDAGS